MDLELVSYISPNLLELRHIHAAMDKAGLMESDLWWKTVDSLGLGSEWRDGVARWGKKNGVEWLAGEGGKSAVSCRCIPCVVLTDTMYTAFFL